MYLINYLIGVHLMNSSTFVKNAKYSLSVLKVFSPVKKRNDFQHVQIGEIAKKSKINK